MGLNRMFSGRLVWQGLLTMLMVCGLCVHAAAATSTNSYLIDHFEVACRSASGDLPPLSDLSKAPLTLDRTARGYTSLAKGRPGVRTDLQALNTQRSVRISGDGLVEIAATLKGMLERDGLMGVSVDVALQQEMAGQTTSHVVWFLVDIPLTGSTPNLQIPKDLAPLDSLLSANMQVSTIHLAWQGDVADLPTPIDFLESLKVPLVVQAGTVMDAPGTRTSLERLRWERGLRWTPQAVKTLTRTIAGSTGSLGADVSTSVDLKVTPGSGPSKVLDYTVTVTPRIDPVLAASDVPAATQSEAIPPPLPAADPAWQAASAKSQPAASERQTTRATPAKQTIVMPQVDGVRIRWAQGDEGRGDLGRAMAAVPVQLQLVDGEVQAGWGDRGEESPLVTLREFPTRGWSPSATRAVRLAIEDQLTTLGMTKTTVSDAKIEDGDRRFIEFTVTPPPRNAAMPPLASESEEIDGTFYYIVWPFEVVYGAAHRDLPTEASFERMAISLSPTAIGWTAPGDNAIETTLGRLNESGSMLYDSSAIKTIGQVMSDHLTDQDLMGVSVQPLADQIPSAGPQMGQDLREGSTELPLVVTVGRVADLRTIARGDRIDSTEAENHPSHQAIREGSPLAVADDVSDGALLRRKALDDYLYFLSRHPGRDVEASVTAGSNQGDVAVDYVVSESKPWTVWYQYGNTGTKNEGYQRHRFGFKTTQLTNNDDILSFQYVTSNFSKTNAVMGRYEAPLGLGGRLRWGIEGSWSQYFADQFGASIFSDAYTGFAWSGGGDLRLNVYQDGPMFIDFVGGARLQHIGVTNELLFGLSDQASFVIPHGSVQIERTGNWSRYHMSVGVEGNVLSHSESELTRFGLLTGRLPIADRWARLNWAGSISTFLEPLLDPEGWGDPSTPATSTLAHEVLFGVSGQYAFGSRLMPQFQSVVGGPGTNRGYPVSIVAGDNALNLTGEYRFHVPRAFGIQPEPGTLFGEPFRMAPQHVYGVPDWDLALLGFVDYSWLTQNDKLFYESDQTLLSAGIGFELIYKANLKVRLDWGWALRALEGGLYDSGHNRVYVQASLSF
ncbi:MAG: hypothetical protein GY876_04300 [Planctomycetes bacterium]|nr:hypothetical protein [Planctomycetota bacterium]